ncbi:NADPH-dependent F420 reductase [Natronosalvus halobius]|uniref:NADPH-dependent F420 reductase n=1 Tax=Natronosalvus halobius TaxID=2953746 RepID=UPI0020A07978|nr:NADPH-dependent F420 reductase [Natronosalvus halobius]USZ73627.1 NADPH-dependent F420 reductase [Natronosalvus halobius]
MRVALLGGTGDIGAGLALRLAADSDHEVVIGSRDADKAADKADEYEDTLADARIDASVDGEANPDAVSGSHAVILAVPPYYVTDTIDAVEAELDDEAILVSPAVGIDVDDEGFHYDPPGVGSVTELAAEHAPADVPVVGAFHNLAAGRLSNLDASLDVDTLVTGEDADAKSTVMALAESIDGIRALDGGPLANSSEIEALTPLLINVAKYNDGMHDVGVEFK